MSRVYLIIAGLFVLAGFIATVFAPVGSMGAQEAFYAHLILIVPPLIAGTIISALAIIIRKLEQLQEGRALSPRRRAEPHRNENEDFNTLFANKPPAGYETSEPQQEDQVHHLLNHEAPAVEQTDRYFESESLATVIEEERRAPTVNEFLVRENMDEQQSPSSKLTREGTFAGRSYRMYEDGSLEIDTDQSTIRFDSLDEFRQFVNSAAD
jgi:hypothetical protein